MLTMNTKPVLVRTNLPGFTGTAHLWKVGKQYVVTSYATTFGAETYSFHAKADGTITNWTEQAGSRKGPEDHISCISGYWEANRAR